MRLPFTAKCGYGEGVVISVVMGWAIGRDELGTIIFPQTFPRVWQRVCFFPRSFYNTT